MHYTLLATKQQDTPQRRYNTYPRVNMASNLRFHRREKVTAQTNDDQQYVLTGTGQREVAQ